MIAVNRDHSSRVDEQANAGVQPTQDECTQWADRLSELAGGVHDPQLAGHAHQMAELVHQSVALNPAMLAELSADQPSPGPAAKQYAALNRQFISEQGDLAQACPA